jgi:hypothetical protein
MNDAFQRKASIICCASHSAVGCRITAIVTASMRPSAGVGIVEIENLKVGNKR